MSALDLLRTVEIPVRHGDLTYSGYSLERLQGLALPTTVVLSAVQSVLKAQVDEHAEMLRGRIVTGGAGQAMEYQEAQSQAAAALKASASATPEKYPMLAASIGIDFDPQTGAPATDVVGVARAVTAAYQAWQAIGAEIRKVRLAAKAAIEAAATTEDAAAAYDAVAWPDLQG